MGARMEVIKVSYVKPSNVSSISDNLLDKKASLVFSAGNTWILFPFTIGSIEFSEQLERGKRGKVYLQKFKASLPGKDRSSQLFVHGISSVPVLLKLDLQDGTSLLVGTLEVPVRLLTNFSSNDNEVLFLFERESVSMAPELTS